MLKQPAIFLDRDGTLIEEVNYLSRIEDLRFFRSTAGAVKLFKDSGFLVIVVTNQSGIGRGVYSEAAMHAIHDEIQLRLGDAIDGFYFCPHLPTEGCLCRKPGAGMIEAAQRDFNIDMEKSWLVGDKRIDIEAGQGVRLRSALVLTGYGAEHQHLLTTAPDIVSADLGSAAAEIVNSIA